MSPETLEVRPSRFVWYEFHTGDAAAAERFYRGVLGWGVQDSGMTDRSYTLVTVGEIPIGGILEKPVESFVGGEKPGWMGYIGVADVDHSVQQLLQAGGVVHRAAESIPNVGRFAVVADPQGAAFVLFQPPDAREQPDRPAPGTPGSAAWHDLAAADWQSDFIFYVEMFGWSKSDAIPMGPNGIYQIFAVGSEPIGGMMTRMDPLQSPGWLFYFHVAEIQHDRVKEHGGTVVHGPSVVPGGQQIAQCLDPQGAIFGIVSPGI